MQQMRTRSSGSQSSVHLQVLWQSTLSLEQCWQDSYTLIATETISTAHKTQHAWLQRVFHLQHTMETDVALRNLHSTIDCMGASQFSLINLVSVLLPFKQPDQALQISPSVFTVSSMSTTESLLVITDEVAETTVLLIPKWSRDSSQSRIDIMPTMW